MNDVADPHAHAGLVRPSSSHVTRLGAWVLAARPKTLAAGIVPVVVGASLAHRHGVFAPVPAAAALAGAVLIQVGTNLANDYHDWRRGADAADRLGPPRASAMGWIPPARVLAASLLCFGLAAAVGTYLVWQAGWPILLVGLLSLASGYAYTGGAYPLGYHGWGDLFVFVFFGLVAVTGTYYVQAAGPAPLDVLWAAVPIGCLATALLVVNNLRDLDADRRAGKRTLAVRLGPTATRAEYTLLLGAAYAVPPGLVLRYAYGPSALLPLATLALAAFLVARAWTLSDPARLNGLLALTSLLLAAYGGLFAAGVALG